MSSAHTAPIAMPPKLTSPMVQLKSAMAMISGWFAHLPCGLEKCTVDCAARAAVLELRKHRHRPQSQDRRVVDEAAGRDAVPHEASRLVADDDRQSVDPRGVTP